MNASLWLVEGQAVVTEGGAEPSGWLRFLLATAVAPLFLGYIEGGVGPSDHLLHAVEGAFAGADPDADGE